MFIIDGQVINIDSPFKTKDGTQYPANWIRLSLPEERAAIGLEEVPDPEWYDQRFYWGVGNPKDLDQLKAQWVAQTKADANSQLQQTDWMVIRKAERNIDIPEDVASARAAVIQTANDKEAAITAATTVEELISAVCSVNLTQVAVIETTNAVEAHQVTEQVVVMETSQISGLNG